MKRTRVETRLLGARFDLLEVVAFSHCANERSYWTCKCECGELVVRSTQQFHKNKQRGRKNGCDKCVPSMRITDIAKRTAMTPEQREARRAETSRKYEAKRKRSGSVFRRWTDSRETGDVAQDGAIVINGIKCGYAKNADELAWLQRVFG